MSVLSRPIDLSTTRRLLASTETYATPLFAIFFDAFGEEQGETEDDQLACLEWAPETIRRSLYEEFQVEIPQQNLDKLMAAILLVTTDDFYRNVKVFIQLCNILSGDTFDPRVFDPANAFECAWGITEALLLAPPSEDDSEPFSDEIRRYVAVVCDNEGILDPPDVLGIALYDQPKPKISVETFGGDAEMFQAFYQSQLTISDALRAGLVDATREVLQQLASLKLRTGSTEYALRLLQKLPNPAADR